MVARDDLPTLIGKPSPHGRHAAHVLAYVVTPPPGGTLAALDAIYGATSIPLGSTSSTHAPQATTPPSGSTSGASRLAALLCEHPEQWIQTPRPSARPRSRDHRPTLHGRRVGLLIADYGAVDASTSTTPQRKSPSRRSARRRHRHLANTSRSVAAIDVCAYQHDEHRPRPAIDRLQSALDLITRHATTCCSNPGQRHRPRCACHRRILATARPPGATTTACGTTHGRRRTYARRRATTPRPRHRAFRLGGLDPFGTVVADTLGSAHYGYCKVCTGCEVESPRLPRLCEAVGQGARAPTTCLRVPSAGRWPAAGPEVRSTQVLNRTWPRHCGLRPSDRWAASAGQPPVRPATRRYSTSAAQTPACSRCPTMFIRLMWQLQDSSDGVISRDFAHAPGRTRTSDTQIRSLVLYPLSYGRSRASYPAGWGMIRSWLRSRQ